MTADLLPLPLASRAPLAPFSSCYFPWPTCGRRGGAEGRNEQNRRAQRRSRGHVTVCPCVVRFRVQMSALLVVLLTRALAFRAAAPSTRIERFVVECIMYHLELPM